MISEQSSTDNAFSKILKQLAEQLWQSKLHETLEDPHILKHLTAEERMNVSSFEQLFELLISKELVTATNITVLKSLLGNHEQGHALLRAVYEAGYGREGLMCEEGGTVESRNRFSAGSFSSCRKFSFGNNKMQRDFKQLLRKIDTQLDSREDLGALKLLCSSVLSLRQLDGVTVALDLFTTLRRARCITMENPQFLYRILYDCGRHDLCDLVDGYVYTCLKKSATDFTTVVTKEKKVSRSETRDSYQFVRALKNVGDQLGSDDLATMKLLADTCIPESKLERVSNVYEFFLLLQERGKLSENYLTFMDQLLDDKPHVIAPLYDMGFGGKSCTRPCSSQQAAGTIPLMNFKRLLKTVGWRLTQENIRDLKYLCSENPGSLSSVQSGIEVLSWLERRGEIGPMNVQCLMDLLQEIGRKDLYNIVTAYNRTIKHLSTEDEAHQSLFLEARLDQESTPTAPSSQPVASRTVQNHYNSREDLVAVETLTAALSQQSIHSDHEGSSSELTKSTSSELLLALSRQTLQHQSELRARERVSDELEEKMSVELEKKNKQIEELTKKVEMQNVLLKELAHKLGVKDDTL